METKTIYLFDTKTKEFIGSDSEVPVNDELVDGQTDVEPSPGLYDPKKFDGIKWIGANPDEYDAKIVEEQKQNAKENPIPPTNEMQAINALGLQMAQMISGGTK